MLRFLARVLVLVLVCVACQKTLPPPLVRVLIIDGQNNHNWKLTTEATKGTLLACGRFEVTVATSPPDRDAAEAWAAWAPDFAAYDVVFSNYNDGGKSLWSEQTQQALASFVHAGGGLVVVHAADNSSSDWPEFNRMIAVGGWGGRTPADGSHLRRTDGKWAADPAPDGASGSHGAQLAFVVESTGLAHPITDGMPTQWMHAKDELYDSLRGPCEEVQVLASAYCPRTERHEPVVMTIAYGEGRVFHTPMGHVGGTDPVHCVGFQTLIARGTEWAATGKVSVPVPAGFPSATEVSVLPPAQVVWSPEER